MYKNNVTMTLTPEMEKIIVEEFGLEIEVIQGSREELADGRARISILITDPDKGKLLETFTLFCIANAQQSISKQ